MYDLTICLSNICDNTGMMEIGLWSLAPLGPATFRIGVMHATTDQLRR